jgi:hypothetical protein
MICSKKFKKQNLLCQKKKKRNKFTDLIKPIVDNLFFKVLDIKKSNALFFFFFEK